LQPEDLRRGALGVLRKNDLGSSTRPAPRLYPHQWSWDSAFVAIGLAHLDLDRALRELETLFAAQWSDGRVPHIVFNPTAHDYFPGPELWDSASSSASAPRQPATSGLVQPPVHAMALRRILERAKALDADHIIRRVERLYPKLLEWHRYLAHHRDPDGVGLLLIYHPWESGTDNSPRWDAALNRVVVGKLEAYRRHDLEHVDDPGERPTHAEYDRYLWLVELLKRAHYEDEAIQRNHPFQIRDVLMSALFACASHDLVSIAKALAEVGDLSALQEHEARFSRGVLSAWDETTCLALDRDERSGASAEVQTCAGLAPLLLPSLDAVMLDKLVVRLRGPGFAGADGLAYPVVPSTVPNTPGFQPRGYWRGPAWPVFNWLMWIALRQHGQDVLADELRASNLNLLARDEARFAEYFEPYTAEPLGSLDQSWTAAVAIDWLAYTPSVTGPAWSRA
jgi:glucosylglycerate hydrolase